MTLPKSLRERKYNLVKFVGDIGYQLGFRSGYDKGVADHAELVKGLVEALETYAHEHVVGNRAARALTAYRAAMSSGDSAEETGEK